MRAVAFAVPSFEHLDDQVVRRFEPLLRRLGLVALALEVEANLDAQIIVALARVLGLEHALEHSDTLKEHISQDSIAGAPKCRLLDLLRSERRDVLSIVHMEGRDHAAEFNRL